MEQLIFLIIFVASIVAIFLTFSQEKESISKVDYFVMPYLAAILLMVVAFSVMNVENIICDNKMDLEFEIYTYGNNVSAPNSPHWDSDSPVPESGNPPIALLDPPVLFHTNKTYTYSKICNTETYKNDTLAATFGALAFVMLIYGFLRTVAGVLWSE